MLGLCAGLCAGLLSGCGDDTGPAAVPPVEGPDVNPPTRIEGPTLTYVDTSGTATLSWPAPQGDPVRYEIRYAYAFPLNWDISIAAANPPAPSGPGAVERYTIESPLRGRDLYAAIRSFDEAGNASDISDIAHAHVTGWSLTADFYDLLTTAPIEGLEIVVTARHVHRLLTDAAGRAAFGDLSSGSVNLSIGSYPSGPLYHNISETFVLGDDDVITSYPMIEYEPISAGGYENLMQLFIDGATGVSQNRVLKKYKVLPVPVYIPTFTNSHGIDYGARTREAIERWELRSGVDLFVEVGAPPATGVEYRFLPPEQMGGQNGITVREQDAEGYPLTDVIKIITTMFDEALLYKILLHEAGHSIRLNHLPSGFIMYASHPLPDDITDEEANVVRLHAALPNDFDLSGYDVNAPPP
jgi:hypothetical protein